MSSGRVSPLFGAKNSSENLVDWKKKFVEKNCNEDLIEYVLKQKKIKDYDNLYSRFSVLPDDTRCDIQNPWELFCLSGETEAFDFAANEIDEECRMTKESVGKWGVTPLHLSAASGSPDQLQRAIDLGIAWDTETLGKMNILHYAAMGSAKQIDKVLQLEKDNKHVLSRTDQDKRTALHIASAIGSVEIIEKTLTFTEIKSHDSYGCNPLDYATKKNRTDAEAYLKSKGLVLSENYNQHSFGDFEQPQQRLQNN